MSDILRGKHQTIQELHRSARKNYSRRRTLMFGIDDTYQIDLVEMIPYAKENKGFKYILTVIDIFSKFAWALPIHSKTGKNVTMEISKIFKSGRVPKHIHSDNGKEFYNKDFQELMKRYKINHYSTFSTMKAAIVERFNRTLKTKMWKRLHLRGCYKWFDILQDIIKEYNNTKHSTIRMQPIRVKKRHEKLLLSTVYKYEAHFQSPKFREGENVRISKYKHVFEKGYTPNWTTEIFKIDKVQLTTPATYLLKDFNNEVVLGSFYEEELQRVKYPDIYLIESVLKRRGNKRYVRWLGFDDSHNSWISKNDLQD